MNKAVSHSYDSRPLYFRMLCFQFGTYVACGLTDDLDSAKH